MVVFLAVDLAIPPHLRHQPFGQGVHHRQAHPVEAAGYLIAATAELSAGVEHRKGDLQGAFAHLFMVAHGNTPAIVPDRNGIIRPDVHLHMGAIPGQGFVDGVIHQLPYQMVQASCVGGADIHAGPPFDRLQPFQHLNFRSIVFFVVVHGISFPFPLPGSGTYTKLFLFNQGAFPATEHRPHVQPGPPDSLQSRAGEKTLAPFHAFHQKPLPRRI